MDKVYRQLSYLSDFDLLNVVKQAKKIACERGLSIHEEKPKKRGDCKSLGFNFDVYMSEDWSNLFDFECSEEKVFYVYIHVDPRLKRFGQAGLNNVGMPFYVGKGVGARAYSRSRSKPHRALIDEIIADGYDMHDIVYIFKSNIDEKTAFEIEAKLINYFGCRCEMPKLLSPYLTGRKAGMLLNTDTSRRPKWIEELIAQINYSPLKARELKKAKAEFKAAGKKILSGVVTP